jgi:NAD(P)-dependent dehydrogenase (short-subunit alcohol dehydrogenase family)
MQMAFDFRGKTVLITGGGAGIGLAMARAFGRRGAQLVLADIDEAAAEAAARELGERQIRAIAVPCDVTDRTSVASACAKAVEAFGKLHVICNNAGVAVAGVLGETRPRDWDWIIDANIKGVVYGTEAALPLIEAHGEGGWILNTASMAGLVSPPGLEPYCATKFAVVAMSEGWAGQLATRGVGVSVLCPGFVKTRIHESGRVRPDRYGGASAEEAGGGVTAQQVLSGLDPDLVGERVAEAIDRGEFYIFTHLGLREAVEGRFAAIRAGFDAAERSAVMEAAHLTSQSTGNSTGGN